MSARERAFRRFPIVDRLLIKTAELVDFLDRVELRAQIARLVRALLKVFQLLLAELKFIRTFFLYH